MELPMSQEIIAAFKNSTRDRQHAGLIEVYGTCTQKVMIIIDQMETLNEITQHYQDILRTEGATMPAEVIAVFHAFKDASIAMSDTWIRNNAIMARCIQLHDIATKQHPSFKL